VKCFARRGVGIVGDDRVAVIPALTHIGHQRNAPQEGHVAFLSQPLAATLAKEVAGHILQHADDGHVELLEHGQAAPRVVYSNALRLRDDNRAGQRHRLGQAELRVTGARRQVHDHVV